MLLRVSEASKVLGLEESTLRKWIFTRQIPVVKVGRCVRIRKEDIEKLIAGGYKPPIAWPDERNK